MVSSTSFAGVELANPRKVGRGTSRGTFAHMKLFKIPLSSFTPQVGTKRLNATLIP
jgi:hypothetical protein